MSEPDETPNGEPVYGADAGRLLGRWERDGIPPAGGKHVLIACLPKTGSTWLSNMFASLPGFRYVELVPAHGRREQELSEWELAKWHRCDYVSARHCCHSEYMEKLCQAFNLGVVFLVRDIGDILVSLDEHLFRESMEIPMGYFDREYMALEANCRYDRLVDLVAPWLIRHYAGWWRAGRRPLTYERLREDPEGSFASLVRALGLAFPPEDCSVAVDRAAGLPARFNHGITDRGRQLLNEGHWHRLQRMAAYYPGVDFEPLGLDG